MHLILHSFNFLHLIYGLTDNQHRVLNNHMEQQNQNTQEATTSVTQFCSTDSGSDYEFHDAHKTMGARQKWWVVKEQLLLLLHLDMILD